MTYRFRYKKWFFWRSLKVVGNSYNRDLDRMYLYFPDGGIRELSGWSKYDCKLGQDWVLAVKKDMESKAGQPIVVKGT